MLEKDWVEVGRLRMGEGLPAAGAKSEGDTRGGWKVAPGSRRTFEKAVCREASGLAAQLRARQGLGNGSQPWVSSVAGGLSPQPFPRLPGQALSVTSTSQRRKWKHSRPVRITSRKPQSQALIQ